MCCQSRSQSGIICHLRRLEAAMNPADLLRLALWSRASPLFSCFVCACLFAFTSSSSSSSVYLMCLGLGSNCCEAEKNENNNKAKPSTTFFFFPLRRCWLACEVLEKGKREDGWREGFPCNYAACVPLPISPSIPLL